MTTRNSGLTIEEVFRDLEKKGYHITGRDKTSIVEEDEANEIIPEQRIPRERAKRLLKIEIDVPNIEPSIPLIFIDGTFKSVRVGIIQVKGSHYPVYLSQIVVGGVRLEEKYNGKFEIVPLDFPTINYLVLSIPYKLLNIELSDLETVPENRRLDHTGNFRSKILGAIEESEGNIPLFITDNSTVLQKGDKSKFSRKLAKMLKEGRIGPGIISRRAIDRARVLMRITELIYYDLVVKEYSKFLKENNSFVVLDGPPVQLSIYLPLIDEEYWQMYYRWEIDKAFETFKYLSGITKRMRVYPADLHDELFGESSYTTDIKKFAWLYWLPDIVNEIGEEEAMVLSRMLLSCFLYIRPELVEKFYKLHPLLGIARFDISIPGILSFDEFRKFTNNLKNLWEVPIDYNNKEEEKRALRYLDSIVKKDEIKANIIGKLKGIKEIAYPIPPRAGSVTSQRWLVEPYPIYELERMIRAQLLHSKKMETIAKFEDLQRKLIF